MLFRCEPFSTYPRTYDLLHADKLLSHYQNHGEGCVLEDIMLEMDRIIRPQVFYIKPCLLGVIIQISFCYIKPCLVFGVCRDSSLLETRNRSSQKSKTWLLSSYGKLRHVNFKTNTRRLKLFYFAERSSGQSSD